MTVLLSLVVLLGIPSRGNAEDKSDEARPLPFVRVSPRDARYLELSDGQPFVPVGLNLCWPPKGLSDDQSLKLVDHWLEQLAANEGNMVRMWLGAGFYNRFYAKISG